MKKCNFLYKCEMMTEIKTIDGGQKDALLKRANLRKKSLNI